MSRVAAKPPRLGGVVELRLSEIVDIDPCNSRRIEPDPALIAQLALDIETFGLLNPLVVRGVPGRWRILIGGRRWRALKALSSQADVRCRVFNGDDEEAAALSRAENTERVPLHPLEIADGYAQAHERLSIGEIAKREHKSPDFINQHIALFDLSETVRKAWVRGAINLSAVPSCTSGNFSAIKAAYLAQEASSDASLNLTPPAPEPPPAPAQDGTVERPGAGAEPIDAGACGPPTAQAPLYFSAQLGLIHRAANRAARTAMLTFDHGFTLRVALAGWFCKGMSPLSAARWNQIEGSMNSFLQSLADKPFDVALAMTFTTSYETIKRAFDDAIAANIDFAEGGEIANRALVDTIRDYDKYAVFSTEFAERFEYGPFCGVNTRTQNVALIREIAGEASVSDRAWLNDAELAQEAALLARGKSWMPELLRSRT